MASNLPTIAQLQDPAWVKSQSQRVQSQIFRATEGKHRAKNDVVKLNSNYVQRRAADKRWKETHPDLYLQQQQQPPAATTTTGGNTTSNGGGGQGQNVRFNQKIDKMDRRAQGQTQTSTATSDRRDATADARDAGAPAPRPSTSVIGTTSSMGAAPEWWKRDLAKLNQLGTPTSLGGNTPVSYNPTRETGSRTVAPGWWTPPAPQNSRPMGAIGVPGGLSPSQQQAAMLRLQAMALSYPPEVQRGGSYVRSANGGPGGIYTDPMGKKYYVTGGGQFMYMGDPTQAVVPQQAISRAAANLRALTTFAPMGVLPSQQSNDGGFGSYYGGGFGGGGGGGGGYTSYDPYNGNPAWYNNTDLTAWNIS